MNNEGSQEEIEGTGRKPPHAAKPSPDLEFVKAWLEKTKVPEWCRVLIVQAYSRGSDEWSDGFSLPWKRWPVLHRFLPKELSFDELNRKHPVGVGHDDIYKYHVLDRRKADEFLRVCLKSLNHPLRSRIWWKAVRWFGYFHW